MVTMWQEWIWSSAEGKLASHWWTYRELFNDYDELYGWLTHYTLQRWATIATRRLATSEETEPFWHWPQYEVAKIVHPTELRIDEGRWS